MDDDQTALLAAHFGVAAPLALLPGGAGRTYRAGAYVLRREADRAEAEFVAPLLAGIRADGFRTPRPVPARGGAWLAGDWSCWEFVAGRAATVADLPLVIPALLRFHQALADVAPPAWLVSRDTPYTRADRQAWDMPGPLDPALAPLVAALMARRRPVGGRPQLIHGDLNEQNILVAPGLPPAIIDMTPYWHPPVFALAVLAYWLGPYRGDAAALPHFVHLPDFAQLLLRVALRTMLISHEFQRLGAARPDYDAEFAGPVAQVIAWLDRAG